MIRLAACFEKCILFLYFSLLCLILLLNIRTGHAFRLALPFLAALLLLLWRWEAFRCRMLNCIRGLRSLLGKRAVFVALLILGLALRLLPVLMDFDWVLTDIQTDCGIHFFAALQMAEYGAMSDVNALYESVFPQLYPYSLGLALAYRLTGSISAAIMGSNILFDAISALAIYGLMKRSGRQANVCVLLWWFNPVFIIMCWLPLAISVVNMLLVLCICCALALFSGFERGKNGYGAAVLLGLLIFLGNLFRPMFYVVLIAVLIISMIYFLRMGHQRKKMSLCALLLLLFSLVPSKLYSTLHGDIQGFEIPENRIGWNFFVGANYDTKGRWNFEDHGYFFSQLYGEIGYAEAQDRVLREGVERYRAMGLTRILRHFINKTELLYANMSEIPFDVYYSFNLTMPFYATLCYLCSGGYLFVLVLLSLLSASMDKEKRREKGFLLCALTLVGLSMAYMLVEVMPRYSTMSYALFILLLGFTFTAEHKSESRN